MEGYAYSYPESGDSSPRSRETDFDTNPPPSWEDQPQPPPTHNHKVKFMVSYSGKIQPRTHDNLLSYVGGETKILAVDRSLKFSSLLSKLNSLIQPTDDSSSSACHVISSFKYQLPGEDLDALISVTNDDDLEHMMHEYDRLYRASPKPARLRLFAFPGHNSGFGSASSDRFVDALNSVPVPIPVPETHPPTNNVDFLFGLDNKVPLPVQVQDPGRVIVSDHRIQELNRLQISAHEQNPPPPTVYRPKSDENLAGAYAGDGYQKLPPAPTTIPAGFWQHPVEQQQQQQHYQPAPVPPQQQQVQQQQQQPVYMIHAPASVYHAPAGVRPVGGNPNQGYYQMQRVPSDPIYREQQQQQVYGMAAVTGQQQGMGVPVRQVAGGMAENNNNYEYQVAYDNGSGRQVYYAAPQGVGVVTAPFQGVSGDMRAAAAAAADGKVVGPKVTQTSAAV